MYDFSSTNIIKYWLHWTNMQWKSSLIMLMIPPRRKSNYQQYGFISSNARMTFMQEWLFCNPIMHYFREYFGERDLKSDGGPVNYIIWFPLNWNVRYKKTQDSIGKSKLHTRCREIWAIIRLYDLERAKVHNIKDNMLLDR